MPSTHYGQLIPSWFPSVEFFVDVIQRCQSDFWASNNRLKTRVLNRLKNQSYLPQTSIEGKRSRVLHHLIQQIKCSSVELAPLFQRKQQSSNEAWQRRSQFGTKRDQKLLE